MKQNAWLFKMKMDLARPILVLFMMMSFSCAQAQVQKPTPAEPQGQVRSQPQTEYVKPTPFEFLTNVPHSMLDAWNMSFNTKSETLLVWAGVVSSTVLFYIYDEEILAEFQRWGRDLHLGNDDNTRPYIKSGSISLFRGPHDVGSTLYFLGDGWTHVAIGTSFLITGALKDNSRALQTGSQMFNGLVSSTIANQVFKRSFGRESPIRSSQPRGAFRPFPSFSTYNNDISKYDAMPTGHLMTATMTYVIIDENYPECRAWFRPLGITWMALLGFQMVNNSVHWISDYPLGMAMGYVFGKVATQYGKVKVGEGSGGTSGASSGGVLSDNKITNLSNWSILPAYIATNDERDYGVIGTYDF